MILFSNQQNSSKINKHVKNGQLRLLTKGIYIDLKDNSEEQIRDKIIEILSHLKVNGILSYSSGLNSDFFDNNKIIWISGNDSRTITLDDMKIIVIKSNEKELNNFATKSLDNTLIKIPNLYRAVLQNFSIRKVDEKRSDQSKAFNLLIEESFRLNDPTFQILLNNLKIHADQLDYKAEYKLIETLLFDYIQQNNLNNESYYQAGILLLKKNYELCLYTK